MVLYICLTYIKVTLYIKAVVYKRAFIYIFIFFYISFIYTPQFRYKLSQIPKICNKALGLVSTPNRRREAYILNFFRFYTKYINLYFFKSKLVPQQRAQLRQQLQLYIKIQQFSFIDGPYINKLVLSTNILVLGFFCQ